MPCWPRDYAAAQCVDSFAGFFECAVCVLLVGAFHALTGWLVASSASMRSASSNRAVALIGYESDMRNLRFRCVRPPVLVTPLRGRLWFCTAPLKHTRIRIVK